MLEYILKKTLAVRPVPINRLKECLLLDVFIGNKKGFALSLYRSQSQSQKEFCFLFLISHSPVKRD